MSAAAFAPDKIADPTVVRRMSDSGRQAVEPFQDAALLTAGKVSLIGLDALVDALGARWQARREQVYDQVEKVLARNLGTQGYFVRVSETDYLVTDPGLGPFGIQAACLRALSELVKHFLGSISINAMSVCKVARFCAGEITAVPVDPREASLGERREIKQREEAANALAQAEANRGLLSPERWSPFIASNGRKVRVSCKLEPVFELKGNKRIGYRLARRVIHVDTEEALTPAEISRLGRADHLNIDMATIARGLARLDSENDAGQALSLIIAVSFITLSNPQGRQLLATAFSKAREKVRAGVICEVCDIEGVPQGPLLSAVSLIRPSSVFVVGYLHDGAAHAHPSMREAGIRALSVSCPPGIEGDVEFIGWARDVVKAAHGVSKSVMIYGCTPRRVGIAGLAGATHASVG